MWGRVRVKMRVRESEFKERKNNQIIKSVLYILYVRGDSHFILGQSTEQESGFWVEEINLGCFTHTYVGTCSM